jgi:hypothetical protein
MKSQHIILNDGNGKGIPLTEVIDFLNVKMAEEKTVYLEQIEAEPGRKFIRLLKGRPGYRYCYCFLDYAGNIYKSATWRAPAKHIRGSVFDKDYGWGKALNHYGASYLR